ncbi:MAG: hypothetical protein ACREV4_06305 [Gammaproteobacteria bacterium]
MTAEQNLRNGAAIMVLGNLVFLIFAVATLFRVIDGGIALGVETFNGVTTELLNKLNPAIMYYSMHVHVVLAGFVVSTAIATAALAWYGVRNGSWWALITAVVAPVVGLIIALPMHYMGLFEYNWMSHLGIIYLGAIVYVAGVLVALVGMIKASPMAAHARR